MAPAEYPKMAIHKLIDTALRSDVKAAKAAGKLKRLYDGNGLFLLVTAKGATGWRWKYRHNNRDGMLSFGVYPDITLKMARDRHRKARELLLAGVNPSVARKTERVAGLVTFKQVADEYLTFRESRTTFSTQKKAAWLLEQLKPLHGRPIGELGTPEMLGALRRIQNKGHRETAHRCAMFLNRVYRYAIQEGVLGKDGTPLAHNPAAHLRGALDPVEVQHRAAVVAPEKVGALLRAIDSHDGYPTTQYALKLAPLLFVRPAELRCAVWSEFDLDNAEWCIPEARMKMKRPHIVPLSRQAVTLFRDLHAHTGRGKLVFPSFNPTRPLSDNSLTSALRRMGYTSEEMTWHGFRTIASTLLNEMGWDKDLIELQLAHKDKDKVRDAYNRAQRLPERRKMMQAWADHLDELRTTYPDWLALPGDRAVKAATAG